jgi:hypothetical protein
MISKAWGEHGAYIHELQQQRVSSLLQECRATLEEKRAHLKRSGQNLLEKVPGVSPSLQLDIQRAKAFRDGEQVPRMGQQGKRGSQTERLIRDLPPMQGLKLIMKDKVCLVEAWACRAAAKLVVARLEA